MTANCASADTSSPYPGVGMSALSHPKIEDGERPAEIGRLARQRWRWEVHHPGLSHLGLWPMLSPPMRRTWSRGRANGYQMDPRLIHGTIGRKPRVTSPRRQPEAPLGWSGGRHPLPRAMCYWAGREYSPCQRLSMPNWRLNFLAVQEHGADASGTPGAMAAPNARCTLHLRWEVLV